MWIHEQLSAKKWEGQRVTVKQHKLDGWRVTLFKQPKAQLHQCVAFGKDREKAGEDRRMDLEFFTRFPRMQYDLKDRLLAMPPFTSVDLEIVVAGKNGKASRSDVITALKDQSVTLHYIAFAVPFFKGHDLRALPLSSAQAKAEEMGFKFAPWDHVDFDEVPPVSSVEGIRSRLVEQAQQKGIEGWVLKGGGQYGKWYKVKPEPTVEGFVTAVVPGQGKYNNQVGAIVVSVYDHDNEQVEVASCSGMTDEERQHMTIVHKQGRLLGRVVEVKYQHVGAKGRLIHPRFHRWREDKSAGQCSIVQLEEGE